MTLQIPHILERELVLSFRRRLMDAAWVEHSQLAHELGTQLLAKLEASSQFMSAALPLRVGPPRFIRYQASERYGGHTDAALRSMHGDMRVRTDLSATLFLSDPESYEGGELAVEDAPGQESSFKLPAGDLVLYHASTVHRVAPLRRGVQLACFFSVQSIVRNGFRRDMLYSLDLSIQRLEAELPDHSSIVDLTVHYHKLVREWADVKRSNAKLHTSATERRRPPARRT